MISDHFSQTSTHNFKMADAEIVDTDYSSWKIADLKKELKAKGLPVSGKKEELVERLMGHTSGDADADLLDDDDDLLHADDTLLTDESIKKAEEELSAQGNKSPKKKIAIKRDVPIPAAVEAEKEPKKTPEVAPVKAPSPSKHPKITGPEEPADDTKENKEDSKDVAKPVAAASVEDKIKSRAERFGGFQSDDAKKAARAQKFADQLNGSSGKGAGKIGGAPAADLDTLKKRAERFGTSTSSVMKKAELTDAMKRRQERFGIVASDEPKPKKITLNSGVNSVILDEKLKKRQERFGLKV